MRVELITKIYAELFRIYECSLHEKWAKKHKLEIDKEKLIVDYIKLERNSTGLVLFVNHNSFWDCAFCVYADRMTSDPDECKIDSSGDDEWHWIYGSKTKLPFLGDGWDDEIRYPLYEEETYEEQSFLNSISIDNVLHRTLLELEYSTRSIIPEHMYISYSTTCNHFSTEELQATLAGLVKIV